MADAQDWRCKHKALIAACRTIRDRFGEEAVDLVARHHMKRVREAFEKKVADTGRNDMAALAENIGTHPETHTVETIRQDDRVLELKITRCAHAEMFAEMNALDIGLKFMCSGDDAMLAGFNPNIELDRPKIMMKGDDCCHFIYRLRE